jgi:phosphonate transport system substrate-binding protein
MQTGKMYGKRQRFSLGSDDDSKGDCMPLGDWTPIQRFYNVIKQVRFLFLMIVPVVVVASVLLVAVDGGQTQDTIKVSLGEKTGISPVQQISGCTFGHHSSNLLTIAIAGVLSPSRTLEQYRGLFTYIGRELDMQATIILKPTYAEINALIGGQFVDLGFVCSLAYVEGSQSFDMELLVAPQMYGETVYYSYLIVPEESSAQSLADLRGSSFAFTDPLSNTGRLAPSYHLSLLDETPVSFFSRYIFTYSHDNSILAVADKLVDAAAVDSLVYQQTIVSNPDIASKTRIIARWGPYGIPPLVVRPALDPQLKQQLQEFFLNLHNSEEGRAILDKMAIDKFVTVSDDIYDSIREMKREMGR